MTDNSMKYDYLIMLRDLLKKNEKKLQNDQMSPNHAKNNLIIFIVKFGGFLKSCGGELEPEIVGTAFTKKQVLQLYKSGIQAMNDLGKGLLKKINHPMSKQEKAKIEARNKEIDKKLPF